MQEHQNASRTLIVISMALWFKMNSFKFCNSMMFVYILDSFQTPRCRLLCSVSDKFTAIFGSLLSIYLFSTFPSPSLFKFHFNAHQTNGTWKKKTEPPIHTHYFIRIPLLIFSLPQIKSSHTVMGHHPCGPTGSMTNMNQQHLIKDDLDITY